MQQIELKQNQLHLFYEPLYNFLKINNALFSEFGPSSFPTDDYGAALEANQLWERIRSSEILEKNKAIRDVITNKMYLSDDIENEEKYHKLLSHVASFEYYLASKSENHKYRRFPEDSLEHIQQKRKILTGDLKRLEIKLMTGEDKNG